MIIRFLFFILFVPLCSCVKKEEKLTKPIVLVSIPPYAYFVKKIAGETVYVETLIPPGVNPHVYEASPQKVKRHQHAALWIYLGEPFDQKVLQFFKNSHKSIQILEITKDIPLLSICEDNELRTEHLHCAHHGGYDLHIWLSPTLAKLQAQNIADALIVLLPEYKEFFLSNLHHFLNELDTLNHHIAHLLDPLKGKAILVSHPAFSYFCKEYHLIQLSIEIEGKDPLPQHITKILKKAKHESIQSILIVPQYSNKGAELIAKSLSLPTHTVDPYAENYSENLLSIAKVIAE